MLALAGRGGAAGACGAAGAPVASACCAFSCAIMSFAENDPITVFAIPPLAAGSGGCFAPQNTQCSAASGRSFVQLAHLFT